jgi:hypothetical protein
MITTDSERRHLDGTMARRSPRILRLAILWLACCGIAVAQSGTWSNITEYPTPTPGVNSQPIGITRGPDGALWFTEFGKIGRITTAGVITEFTIPTTDSSPEGITAGPDGALWFTEYKGNQIGRITMAGAITEYPIPTTDSGPAAITPGPDGSLWFTEELGNKYRAHHQRRRSHGVPHTDAP